MVLVKSGLREVSSRRRFVELWRKCLSVEVE